MLRGVPTKPPVGLLSELESLRYLEVGSYYKQPAHPIWVVASDSHFSVLFGTSASVQHVDEATAIEERLLASFSEFDQEGNGFVSGEHLPTLVAGLPQWQTPPLEELRSLIDPDGTSLLVWEAFHRVMMQYLGGRSYFVTRRAVLTMTGAFDRYHPEVVSGRVQVGKTGPGGPAAGSSAETATARAVREDEELQAALALSMAPTPAEPAAVPEGLCHTLFHYNGLAAAGHTHKRALRSVQVRPAGGGQSEGTGLAAVLLTRWKGGHISYDGPPPSIN